MRCKCCNVPLVNNDRLAWNKFANKEEDLCSVCRSLTYNSHTEREYVGGRYPTDGMTANTPTRD